MTPQDILNLLGIDDDVVNIYPYGSRVYGTATDKSDTDFIIVTKNALLKSGAFRDNAISSEDYTVQGVLYSRGGFQDALNNYEMGALECMFLPDELVVMKKWPFRLPDFKSPFLAKKVIQKISNSWHIADRQYADGHLKPSRKGIFHALRILDFALQLKEHGRITDYSSCNDLKLHIDGDIEFRPSNYIPKRDELMGKLKEPLNDWHNLSSSKPNIYVGGNEVRLADGTVDKFDR